MDQKVKWEVQLQTELEVTGLIFFSVAKVLKAMNVISKQEKKLASESVFQASNIKPAKQKPSYTVLEDTECMDPVSVS